jgi:uncharacterized protein (DUF2062 family)
MQSACGSHPARIILGTAAFVCGSFGSTGKDQKGFMPFRRRVPLTWKHHLHDWIWPRIGLRRALKVHWHRLRRLPGTPASIARGFAWGIGVSMNPVVGTHMILSAIGARLTGGSIVAAVIATFAINPWTAPPVWFGTYYIGRLMEGGAPKRVPPFIAMFRGLVEAVWGLNPHLFATQVWPILRPMILGSIPVGIVVGFVSYAVLRSTLTRLRATGRHTTAPKQPETPSGH